jgi:xylulose-5-phosphate/fructose-6-phosphate phosphoketolase
VTVRDGGAAADYWRAACLLSFSHAAGLAWPPPGSPQRSRAAGHWGCNPGIAWAAGHLAEASAEEFLLIVGTGHAGSFVFAQQALRSSMTPAEISEANRRYGQSGGEPTELMGLPDVPYIGGELGPALGVGQGIAASLPGLRVVTVIGDGECETPVALAALAHHDVLPAAPGSCWLPVINVNGARMGSAARFSPERLQKLLEGMGFTVVRSGPRTEQAATAADRAWQLALAGSPVVWLSVSEKGWPAPELLGNQTFRGPHAHKPRNLDLTDEGMRADIDGWLRQLNDPPVIGPGGAVSPAVRHLAGRIRLELPTVAAAGEPVARGSGAVASGAVASGARGSGAVASGAHSSGAHSSGAVASGAHGSGAPCDRSPMAAVDEVLAARSVRIFSPDEGVSNRLDRCLVAGLVTEVLAEELCCAWTWGSTEAGTPSALVSYEAFAPLVSTQLAQYLKLITARPPAGRPPLTVVLTSLGWGNAPTHQNTDLVGGLLARTADCPVRAVFPIGAASAHRRMNELLDQRDVLGVVTCSKQPLLDLPDPGGAAVGVRMKNVTDDDATILAVGDVAVTEAAAAMALAAEHGIRIGVVALVEPGRLDLAATRRACPPDLPSVAVSWVASHHLAPVYWSVRPAPSTHLGYRERWRPTAWETLAANGLTRWSLLHELRAAGCALPSELDRPSGSAPLVPDSAPPACEVRRL